MKEFDLKAALSGEPVMLKNGQKAFAKFNLLDDVENLEPRDAVYPLFGYRFENNYVYTTSWDLSGQSVHFATSEYNIIGMWEEPKLTTEEIMEKAYKERLIVRHSVMYSYHNGFKVVGKTIDNSYILQDHNDGKLQHLSVFNENLEWSIKE